MSGLGSPSFSLPEAVSVAFASGIFLGLFIISIVFANRWLILTDDGWSFKKRIHWYTFITTNITAVLVLFEEAVDVSMSIAESKFVERGVSAEVYVEVPWRPIIKCLLFDIISLLTDTFLMYRLWSVYAKRMSVMWFPCILWIGNVACIGIKIYLQVKNVRDPNVEPLEWSTVGSIVGPKVIALPFLASTIALNAYCTGLLIWRIWKSLERGDGESSGVAKQLQFLIRILMESGVLYLSVSIVNFVVYFGHDRFAIHMIGTLRVIVVGIAYNLIIIRVGKNKSKENDRNPSHEDLSTLVFVRPRAEGDSIGPATIPRVDEKNI